MKNEKTEVSKQDVLETYEKADTVGKTTLEKVFGKDFFSSQSNYKKLWEDFKEENKLQVVLPYSNPSTRDEESINAYFMLIHIVHIKNNGWIPDWDNENEYKYYPYFDLRSGFGFSFADFELWPTLAPVGSRLCFKSRQLADEVGRYFLPIYQKLLTV